MKIRLTDEYKELLGRINISKSEYSQEHDKVDIELEKDIQYYKEQRKIWDKRLFKYNIAVLIMWGLSFFVMKSFYAQKELLTAMLIELGIFSIITVILIVKKESYTILLSKTNKIKNKKHKKENNLIGDFVSLNKDIDKAIISIITINEHYYELSSLKDNKELLKKWDKYTKEIIGVVNLKNNFSSTYSDYQDLYNEYYEYFTNLDI